jgi:outer membrane protein assembly factor BamE (lipoprotein component of BamABCDE complex)
MLNPRNNRILILIFSAGLIALSGCIYSPAVQQGTVLTSADMQAIHRGMSASQVKARLGKPVLMHLYRNHQLMYVYTMQRDGGSIEKRKLVIHFRKGKVTRVTASSTPDAAPSV